MNINNSHQQSIDIAQYQQSMPTTTSSAQTVNETSNQQTSHQNNSNGNRKQDFIEAIEKANHIETGKTECQFSIHEGTNHLMLKIVDQSTKEVIKELPSEKVLDMVAKMCEFTGVFVNEKR